VGCCRSCRVFSRACCRSSTFLCKRETCLCRQQERRQAPVYHACRAHRNNPCGHRFVQVLNPCFKSMRTSAMLVAPFFCHSSYMPEARSFEDKIVSESRYAVYTAAPGKPQHPCQQLQAPCTTTVNYGIIQTCCAPQKALEHRHGAPVARPAPPAVLEDPRNGVKRHCSSGNPHSIPLPWTQSCLNSHSLHY
jgi:hypothetical protein